MFCPNCGSEIDDHVKFCTKCGARIPDLQAEPARPEEDLSETVHLDETEDKTLPHAVQLKRDAYVSTSGAPKQNRKPLMIGGAVLGLAAVVAAIAVTMGGGSEGNLKKQMRTGEKYLLEENYEEAIIAFEKAIEIDPKNPTPYIRLADIYSRQKDYAKAVEILEKAQAAGAEENDAEGKLVKRLEIQRTLLGTSGENAQAEYASASDSAGEGPVAAAEIAAPAASETTAVPAADTTPQELKSMQGQTYIYNCNINNQGQWVGDFETVPVTILSISDKEMKLNTESFSRYEGKKTRTLPLTGEFTYCYVYSEVTNLLGAGYVQYVRVFPRENVIEFQGEQEGCRYFLPQDSRLGIQTGNAQGGGGESREELFARKKREIDQELESPDPYPTWEYAEQDLDGDGVPELIASIMFQQHARETRVFAYRNGTLKQIEGIEAGTGELNEKGYYVVTEGGGMSCFEEYYKMVGDSFVKVHGHEVDNHTSVITDENGVVEESCPFD